MSLIRLDYQDLSKLLSKILLKQNQREKIKRIEKEVLNEVFK